MHYYYTHFTDGETEAEKGNLPMVSQAEVVPGFNPDFWLQSPRFLTPCPQCQGVIGSPSHAGVSFLMASTLPCRSSMEALIWCAGGPDTGGHPPGRGHGLLVPPHRPALRHQRPPRWVSAQELGDQVLSRLSMPFGALALEGLNLRSP